MIVLGLSAYVHDAAAALVVDGQLVSNVEEERLNREKHTAAFPERAIHHVLSEAGLRLGDVDAVAFNWDPWQSLRAEGLKWLLAPQVAIPMARHRVSPKNLRSIRETLGLRRRLEASFGRFPAPLHWVEHHRAHLASSYGIAPFNTQPALGMVVDGHGDDASTTLYRVEGGHIRELRRWPILDSLGLLYTGLTQYLGLRPYEEGKTMALASYGSDACADAFRQILELRPDGDFRIRDKRLLGVWHHGDPGLHALLGPPRKAGEPLEQHHFDLAHSMQQRVKEAVLHVLEHYGPAEGLTHLALSGGVFLNCDLNHAILATGRFDQVFVPPFTSDTGGAAGAALYTARRLGEPAMVPETFSPYTGPAYDAGAMEAALGAHGLEATTPEDPVEAVADLLMDHKVLGWFQGRMECGPRALGNRSILANPTSPTIREHLNQKVKLREWFRPFAPIVTPEDALRCFEVEAPLPELTQYMLVTLKVRDAYRDALPGITHVDGTARIQLVTQEANPRLHRLLKAFGRRSGFEVLVNTSFNRQEPIVCSPEDAVRCYLGSTLDGLVLGDRLVVR